MTAPVGFLDFFVLEASDYIEQLDALLQGSGEGGHALMDSASGQALGELLPRNDLHGLPSEFSGVALGGLRGRQKTLDPALGVGECRQHRMTAVKPDRLVAAGRFGRTRRARTHGEAL